MHVFSVHWYICEELKRRIGEQISLRESLGTFEVYGQNIINNESEAWQDEYNLAKIGIINLYSGRFISMGKVHSTPSHLRSSAQTFSLINQSSTSEGSWFLGWHRSPASSSFHSPSHYPDPQTPSHQIRPLTNSDSINWTNQRYLKINATPVYPIPNHNSLIS